MTPQDRIPFDYFKNGALLVYPDAFKAKPWPVAPDLPSRLYDHIAQGWFTEIERDDGGLGALLRPLFGLLGALGFSPYYSTLALRALEHPHPAITVDASKPFVSPFILQKTANIFQQGNAPPGFKDYVAAYGQQALFRLAGLFKITPRIKNADGLLTKQGIQKNVRRLLRPEGVLRAFGRKPDADTAQRIDALAGRLISYVSEACAALGASVRPADLELMRQGVRNILMSAWSDRQAIARLTGKTKFDVVAGSASAYLPCLLGLRALENGGEFYASTHGVYVQTMNMADPAAMFNSGIYWTPSKAVVEDCLEGAKKIPPGIRSGKPQSLDLNMAGPWLERYRDAPVPEAIKTVLVLGRHMPSYCCPDFVLDFPCVLQFEKELIALLCEAGYKVIFKAHPESEWHHFKTFFDSRTTIESRSFEKIGIGFDAVVMHDAATTVLPDIIARPVHLFMMGDGWHNVKSWSVRMQKFFRDHARMLPVTLGKSGFFEYDAKALMDCFKTPVTLQRDRIVEYFEGPKS